MLPERTRATTLSIAAVMVRKTHRSNEIIGFPNELRIVIKIGNVGGLITNLTHPAKIDTRLERDVHFGTSLAKLCSALEPQRSESK